MSFKNLIPLALLMFAVPVVARAHDTWVQTNTNIVRAGDNIHIDLMLGNHGNEHRDFKLAGKITLDGCKLDVIAPSGKKFDLKDRLTDIGYVPKEGFWTARFAATEPGLYMVAHSRDGLHNTTRSIKSGKTFFIVSASLDKVPKDLKGFDKPLGHPLEIVPMASPTAPMGPGQPIKVQVLYQGKPMKDARVSFIPRGVELSTEFDETYERKTGADGLASYTPKEGNYVLVVVHREEPEQKGTGYDGTKYSATLTVFVPEVCPCCE
jgi:uncharacterized GH25 family protein